jgi:HAD superfamily hydrolase (TIGR01509 family)
VSQLVVFLDLGGVIVDKEQQSAQFQRLVGDYFASLFGGTAESWIEAHRVVTQRLSELESIQALTSFVNFYWAYQLHWVSSLSERQGMLIPSVEECIDLANRANTWISRRIQAALPGAVEAIRCLHRQGYTLHTASGSCSLELVGSLEGMGVRDCFGRLYGADLVNTFKAGPEYYARLFADVGIQPAEALVVDDNADALHWAAQLGAGTVLVSISPHPQIGAIPRLGSLAELPAFL